jgi:hypothetical protein
MAEMAFVEPARKKALLPGDESVWIKRGRAEIDQSAVYEVADFNRSDRRLRGVGDNMNAKSLLFAPNE